jgi:hypothetical protein
MKRHKVALFTVLLLTSLAGVAAAKDICLENEGSGEKLLLRKVKKLKPGGAIALSGTFVSGGNFAACNGAAAMNSAGSSVMVGVLCHSLVLGNNFSWEWTATDATLTGTGDRDTNGDYEPDGSPITINSIDCSTVTIP